MNILAFSQRRNDWGWMTGGNQKITAIQKCNKSRSIACTQQKYRSLAKKEDWGKNCSEELPSLSFSLTSDCIAFKDRAKVKITFHFLLSWQFLYPKKA